MFSRAANDGAERLAVVGVDAEVARAALGRVEIPEVVVAEHEHRPGRRAAASSSSQPSCVGRDLPRRPCRAARCRAPRASRRRRRPRTARPRALIVGSSIASWLPRTWRMPRAEPAVRGEERGVLLLGPEVREVALHEHGVGIERVHLGDRAAVHRLRVRRLTRRARSTGPMRRAGSPIFPHSTSPKWTSFDGRERREQPSRRARRGSGPCAGRNSSGAHAVDLDRVLGDRLEARRTWRSGAGRRS